MTTGQGNTIERMNLRIAELLKSARSDEIVEILSGSETSLLRATQQQQQQQQQQARPGLQTSETGF
jgi:hypothetical protein